MTQPGTPGTTSPLGQGVTGLTLDMLAERIDHEREMRETREQSAAEALRTATTALEARLAGLNEFRQSLIDQNHDFVHETVFDAKIDGLAGRLTLLERSAERTAGGLSAVRFLVVLVGAPGVAALLYVLASAFSGHTVP